MNAAPAATVQELHPPLPPKGSTPKPLPKPEPTPMEIAEQQGVKDFADHGTDAVPPQSYSQQQREAWARGHAGAAKEAKKKARGADKEPVAGKKKRRPVGGVKLEPKGDLKPLIVGVDGKREADKGKPGEVEGKIVVRETVNADESALVYKSTAYYKDGSGGWKSVSSDENKLAEHESEEEAFEHAAQVLDLHIHGLYREALRTEDKRALTLYRLRGALRDEAEIAVAAKQVWHEPATEAELPMMLQVLNEACPELDSFATLAFQFRHEVTKDGLVDWTQGKDRDGTPFIVAARASKCSVREAETFRRIIGYAPEYVITICRSLWDRSPSIRRKGILMGALSSCRFARVEGKDGAEDKLKLFISKKLDVAGIVRRYGAEALAESIVEDIKAEIAAFRDHEQLSFLEEAWTVSAKDRRKEPVAAAS